MSDDKQAKEIDRWRRNLEEAEAELEQKTRQWENTQDFLLQTITKLARLSDSGDANIGNEIQKIKSISENPDDIPQLKGTVDGLMKKLMARPQQPIDTGNDDGLHGKELGQLIDKLCATSAAPKEMIAIQHRVKQISNENDLNQIIDEVVATWGATKQQGAVDPSKFCALLVAEILYQLLEKINLPADLSDRLSQLKQQLEAGIEGNKWADMLNEIAEMASAVQLRINHERLDIEVFLKQVTGRLQELDSFIVGSQENRKQSFLNGQAFGDAVKNEMRSLVKGADSEVDIDNLKNQIQKRLAAIEEHFNGFRSSESERVKTADSDIEQLKARLISLEEESKNLRAKVQKERLQAQTDALTGVPNRLGYEQRVTQEFARWKRFKNSLVLIVCDVDHFKRINDDYGHAAGDKALKTIAKILSNNIRETDYLARYGGEEFVLIMPGASQDTAHSVGEKLREAVEHSGFHFKGEPLTITMSCGIAEFKEGDVPLKVFERADAALYEAKESGRNKVVIAK